MIEEKAEEAQEEATEEEVSEETQAEEKDPVEELRLQLQAERENREKVESKVKDLSSRLTREQQVRAELERYHTKTLPEINKKFEDLWEESPEKAVDTRVNDKVTPVSQEVARLRAENAFTQLLVENPQWAQYKDRVIELGSEKPDWTYEKKDIEKLFHLAERDDLKEKVERMESRKEIERQKGKAYTESSSPKEIAKPKPKLSAAQMQIVDKLGITPEQYLERMK